MKCDRCGKNDATFYYKSNINGRVTETHLCQDCARQMGYAEPMASRMGGWFDDDWFSRPFSLFEPLFGGLGSRMLTEFPQPVNVLEQAQTADEKADDGCCPRRRPPGLRWSASATRCVPSSTTRWRRSGMRTPPSSGMS